jgi:hypothetical protein
METMISKLTNRFLDMLGQEMDKEEMRMAVRKKVINPLLSIIHSEVYPYIYGFLIIIILILILCIMNFVLFFFSTRKYKT